MLVPFWWSVFGLALSGLLPDAYQWDTYPTWALLLLLVRPVTRLECSYLLTGQVTLTTQCCRLVFRLWFCLMASRSSTTNLRSFSFTYSRLPNFDFVVSILVQAFVIVRVVQIEVWLGSLLFNQTHLNLASSLQLSLVATVIKTVPTQSKFTSYNHHLPLRWTTRTPPSKIYFLPPYLPSTLISRG